MVRGPVMKWKINSILTKESSAVVHHSSEDEDEEKSRKDVRTHTNTILEDFVLCVFLM